MDESIELNAFLSKLVSAIARKFQNIESEMRTMRSEMDRMKQANTTQSIKPLEDKVRNLEMVVNSLKSKSQIDSSILKLIETEESQRK